MSKISKEGIIVNCGPSKLAVEDSHTDHVHTTSGKIVKLLFLSTR